MFQNRREHEMALYEVLQKWFLCAFFVMKDKLGRTFCNE